MRSHTEKLTADSVNGRDPGAFHGEPIPPCAPLSDRRQTRIPQTLLGGISGCNLSATYVIICLYSPLRQAKKEGAEFNDQEGDIL